MSNYISAKDKERFAKIPTDDKLDIARKQKVTLAYVNGILGRYAAIDSKKAKAIIAKANEHLNTKSHG